LPNWFKEGSWKEFSAKTLNAKLETLSEKASFKPLIHSQRCIVPSTGFYEFQHQGKIKQPFFIYPKHSDLFNMAGLFSYYNDVVNQKMIGTFTIITCPANQLLSEIHNTQQRMPLILSDEKVERWLADIPFDDDEWYSIPSVDMSAHPIDKQIIHSKNQNIPQIQQPYEEKPPFQLTLF
jgi:putative SOS response-associated peptidase YedK